MKKLFCLVLFVLLFFISAKNISAQDCQVVPDPVVGQECFNYEVPWQVAIGDTDPSEFINTPSCKKADQISRGVTDLKVGNNYLICCPTSPIRKSCSEYMVRTSFCGNAEEAEIKCAYSSDGAHLSCWGNNYRRCETTSPDFPVPDEGNSKRQGYLNGDGTFSPTDGKTYSGATITYNGKDYPVNNQKIWFCDANVPNCGPGGTTGGEGESRLWFPHLRLIAALSTIAQSIFNPHPSSLINNTPDQKGEATLENPGLLTTKIIKHQGIDDPTDVVNKDDNNSSLKVGEEAPKANNLLSYTQEPFRDAQCVIPEVKNNPGDDLLGPKITARLLYTQKYEYEACPKLTNCTPDGTETYDANSCCSLKQTRAECVGSTTDLGNGKFRCEGPPQVERDTKGRASVFIKNPLVEYIYDVMVDGSTSLFKRFMPSIVTGDFEEIPSSVAYNASAVANNEGGRTVSIKAGDGSASYPVFYVPHIGSLKKYWLEDLQKALRPKGVGATQPLPTPRSPSACVAPEPFSQELSNIIDAAIARGGGAARVPKTALEAIYSIEGYTAFTLANYACQKNSATALGLMQITDGIMDDIASPSEIADSEEGFCGEIVGKLNRCNPVDAMELAARVLLFKVGKLQSGSITGKSDIYKAAYGYYGCYDPDQMTNDRGNDDWGSELRMGPAIDNKDGETNYSEVVCWRSNFCTKQSDYPWPRPADSCGP